MAINSLCDALVAELEPLLIEADVECALLAGDHVRLTSEASDKELADTFRNLSLLIVTSRHQTTEEKHKRDIVETAWNHNLWGGIRILPAEDFYKWGGKNNYFSSGVPVREIYPEKVLHVA